MTASAGDNEDQRASIGIALPKHRGEVARCLSVTKDSGHFDVGRQSFVSHVSGSSGRVALVRAHQHGGQRVTASRPAHLFKSRDIARHTANRRQRLQMLGARVDRRQ